jgi:hypothetical protein
VIGPVHTIESFLRGEIDSSVLLARLEPHVVVTEDDEGRTHVRHNGARVPNVQFTRGDVVRALDRVISGEIPLEELAAWANLITLLDFFDLASSDNSGDEVWEVLDRLAHPELTDIDEPWKLRELRASLDP